MQPIIFGWFEYLNNIDINEKESKTEMEKTKNLLQINSHGLGGIRTVEEIQTLMQSQQKIVDSRMTGLMGQILKCVEIGEERTTYVSDMNRTDDFKSIKSIKSSAHSSSSLLFEGDGFKLNDNLFKSGN